MSKLYNRVEYYLSMTCTPQGMFIFGLLLVVAMVVIVTHTYLTQPDCCELLHDTFDRGDI